MCQSVTSFYSCNCAGENYIQRCQFPGLKCVENLKEPTSVSFGIPCSRHTSKFERKAAKASKKEKDPYYPPTSFTKKVARGLLSSQATERSLRRSTVPPRTPKSESITSRRASTSSSIYSDASVSPSIRSRSARSRTESYAQLLDLGPLSLEQSTSLTEAQATLRRSIKLDNQRRASEAMVFDREIAPAISRQPSQRIQQTILKVTERRNLHPTPSNTADILSPRTANTHPALRDQLSPRPSPQDPTPIPNPATLTRNTALLAAASGIRASLDRDRDRALISSLPPRPRSASTTATARTPSSPIEKREYKSWAARPSHTRATRNRNAERLMPQTPPATHARPSNGRGSGDCDEDDILEEDMAAINGQLSERERYELFLAKDRMRMAMERRRRAERRARGGRTGEMREKSDGICGVM